MRRALTQSVLASDIFQRQDLTAYLLILYAAIQQHGSPETLVSDSGGIFKAKQAQVIYHALEITKEQIHRKQAWENLIETQLSICKDGLLTTTSPRSRPGRRPRRCTHSG